MFAEICVHLVFLWLVTVVVAQQIETICIVLTLRTLCLCTLRLPLSELVKLN